MKLLYLLVAFSCLSSRAQETFDCNLRRYLNNDYVADFDVKFYLITNQDTIACKTERSKIVFPILKENFHLELEIENQVLQLGAYRPSEFTGIVNIVIGKVTKIKKLTKFKTYPDMYMVDEMYPLTIQKPKKNETFLYCMFESDAVNADGKKIMQNRQYLKRIKAEK